MKKLLYLMALMTVVTSCKKYLDVEPESQIEQTQLFKTEEGFKEALNGVYTLCASKQLYGGNLTFGNLDAMAQNYQFNDVINQGVANFNYTLPAVVDTNASIWATSYRAIANCNYILNAIDAKKNLFSGYNYQLIKGEALTLRAYLHFDLLRMFAPSYKSNPPAKGIPYVTTVTTLSTPFSTVSGTLDKIIADLNAAKDLLHLADPLLLSTYTVGYPGDGFSNETDNPDLFLQNRRHRLNYYAACGELARVYLYKGDMTNSLANALDVINSKKFPFTSQDDFFAKDPQKKDRIFYKELVASWFIDNDNINNELITLFTQTNPVYSGTESQVEDIYETSQDGAEDWRFKQWFVQTASTVSGPDRAILLKYDKNITPQTNLHPQVAPAIRLSEMYYIAAEASYDTNPGQALTYFNTMRSHRGIGDAVTSVDSKDEFITLLLKEARKEFYGESQLFYMYKRLNHAVVVSSTQTIPPSDRIFVFPLPLDEQTYGNHN